MNILSKLFSRPPEPQIKVQLVSSSTLTLDQWRKDTKLVASAKELARIEIFSMMVAVLENSHVRFLALPTTGATQDDRAAMQARSEGYQICLNNLEAMSRPSTIFRAPEAKFLPADRPSTK